MIFSDTALSTQNMIQQFHDILQPKGAEPLRLLSPVGKVMAHSCVPSHFGYMFVKPTQHTTHLVCTEQAVQTACEGFRRGSRCLPIRCSSIDSPPYLNGMDPATIGKYWVNIDFDTDRQVPGLTRLDFDVDSINYIGDDIPFHDYFSLFVRSMYENTLKKDNHLSYSHAVHTDGRHIAQHRLPNMMFGRFGPTSIFQVLCLVFKSAQS